MHSLMIVFILCMCFAMYIIWAQQDDISFLIILILLMTVLYVVRKERVESFVDVDINTNAFMKLTTLGQDVVHIFQPSLQHLLASFKGEAKPDIEQKYDDQGNEVEQQHTDQVKITGNEKKIRSLNRILRDMKRFDHTAYEQLLSLA